MRIDGKILAWILALGCFGLMPFAIHPGLQDIARYPQLIVLGLATMPLVAAFAFWRHPAPLISISREQLLPLLMLALVVWSGLSAVWSINPAEAWFSTVQLALLVSFFVVARQACRQWPDLLPRVAKVLVVSMSCLALLGMLQSFGLIAYFQAVPDKLPRATMTNPNFFADALLFGLPFCLWAVVRLRGLPWRVAAAVAIAWIVAGIFLSNARSSLIPILIVAMVFAPVWIWRNTGSVGRKIAYLAGWAAVLVVAIWATSFVFRKKEGTTNFHYLWEHGHLIGPRTSSIDHRFIVWHQTMDLASQRLLTGCGAGNWKMNIQALGVKGFDDQAGYALRIPLQPHNEYLGVLSELGVPGLLIVALIGGIGFLGAWKQAFSKDGKTDAALGACLLAGLFFFFFDANFSFPMERPFQAMMLFWMLALSQRTGGQKEGIAGRWQMKAGWALAGIALVAAAVTLQARIPADMAMLKLRAQKEKHQSQEMLKTAENAENWATQLDNASAMPVDWYRAMAHAKLGQLPQALKAMEKAFEQAPFQFGVRSSYASLLDMAGRPADGANRLGDLLVTFPDYEEGWINLAIMRIHAGQLPEARAALGKANPGFSPDKYHLIDQTLRASGQ